MTSLSAGIRELRAYESLLSGIALVSLCLVSYWVYSPGISGGLLLDDHGTLASLEILRSSADGFFELAFADGSGPFGRILSVGLFAFEYAFLVADTSVLKYHSILLHLINTCLVFWLTYLLLGWRRRGDAAWLALIAAAIWSLSPLQVSTVLYVVQRMAMLCATFTLLALIAYLKGRAASSPMRGVVWYLLSLISVLAAPLAKENGLLVIPLILLMEFFWLATPGQSLGSLPAPQRGVWWLMVIGALVLGAVLATQFDWLQRGFDVRSFTLWERLSSQPRALGLYALNFVWPDVMTLGIYHDDFPIGEEYSGPRDLLFSVVLLLMLAGVVWSSITGRWKSVSFIVAGYFCLHSAESSVLALEAYFEHRNYLPGVFIALAVALLIGKASVFGIRLPAILLLGLFLIASLSKTSFLAGVWSNEMLLSIHHVHGHPDSRRAASDIATQYAKLGDYDRAEQASRRAYENAVGHKAARKEAYGDYLTRSAALACLAGRDALPEGMIQFAAAAPERPLLDANNLEVILRQSRSDRCPGFDWDGFMSVASDLYLEGGSAVRASGAVYTALAALAYDRVNLEHAIAYADLALDVSERYVLANFIQMQSFVEQARMPEARAARDRLLAQSAEGLLAPSQQQTLELYRNL